MGLAYDDNEDREILFKNVHGNYYYTANQLVYLFSDSDQHTLADYNTQNKEIRKALRHALDANKRFRACGALWSLSEVAYVDGACAFHRKPLGGNKTEASMLYKEFLAGAHLEGSDKNNKYLFCQSGLTIKQINEHCKSNKRSLKTSGASNGQTIAGAISTGVHGSSINVGSIQDTVCGLHLIYGPDKKQSIYLEPKSRPVASKSFASSIGATLLRDDELFGAALVGLGAFGYIHGVLLETEPKFTLRNHIKAVTMDQIYSFMDSLHVTSAGNIKIKPDQIARPSDIVGPDGIVVNQGSLDHLFHMKFFINQYDVSKCRAEIIYKLTRDVPKLRRQPDFLKYNKDFCFSVGRIIAPIFAGSIPKRITKQFPALGSIEEGTLGEIFTDTKNIRDGQFSCAAAIDLKDATRALRLLMNLAANSRKIPATYSMRFVKKTKATLGFTRYKMNCLFGIDGMNIPRTRNFQKRIAKLLVQEQINHTWHWGKVESITHQNILDSYGDDVFRWVNARENLFGRDQRLMSLFSNEYLEDKGLT